MTRMGKTLFGGWACSLRILFLRGDYLLYDTLGAGKRTRDTEPAAANNCRSDRRGCSTNLTEKLPNIVGIYLVFAICFVTYLGHGRVHRAEFSFFSRTRFWTGYKAP